MRSLSIALVVGLLGCGTRTLDLVDDAGPPVDVAPTIEDTIAPDTTVDSQPDTQPAPPNSAVDLLSDLDPGGATSLMIGTFRLEPVLINRSEIAPDTCEQRPVPVQPTHTCVPECASGSYCSYEQICVPTPELKRAGILGATTPGGWSLNGIHSQDLFNQFSLSEELLPDGATVSISASGDSFPAFSGDVTAFDRPTLLTPAVGTSSSPGSVTADAFDITWAASSNAPATMLINITFPTTAEDTFSVLCNVVDDGAFTVPANLLQGVPSAPANISLSRVSDTVVPAGDQQVRLRLQMTSSGYVSIIEP